MPANPRFASAKALYKNLGVDVEAALKTLERFHVSMHCWQGDDVVGFDHDGALTGGIQTTGNYPGRARTPKELMADIEKALSLIPGTHRLNLHANYAIFGKDGFVDRDALEPRHFAPWVAFAKKAGLKGLDFNPTYFSHPLAASGRTLSSEDEKVRRFWIRHTVACLRIAECFAREMGTPSALNIWIPDGLKDIPADRTTPRAVYKKSLDEIFATDYDRSLVEVTIESKLFGIGLESYTVGSHEFYMNYAAKNNLLCLLDSGHFHLSENVADKISSMLLFAPKIAFHVSRPVRWDSDHVLRQDDMLLDIAREIALAGPDRVVLALDYFDASINRVAAWVIGMRNMLKALLAALLQPNAKMAKLQSEGRFTELLMLQEEVKNYPMGDVWAEWCRRAGVPAREDWFAAVEDYERKVQRKRR
jgi:L-rhamnose isomerase